jgi:putative transposase
LADIKRKQARRRTARTHVITTELTRRFSYVAIEDLKLKNMTGSAKGDAETPGKKVKQKAGLNRAILNVSMYKIREQLEYKSEKSGTTVKAVDPKHTSQTCFICDHKSAGNRKKQDQFVCEKCNHQDNADVNAAKNILKRANPSAAVLGRHKSPSKSTALGIISKKPTDLATTKASGSCFQPASVLKMAIDSRGLQDVR